MMKRRMLRKHFIAIVCAISMLVVNAAAVEAGGEITLDPESNITYDELPDDVKEMVGNGDYVYYDEENDHYYLVPMNPLNTSSGGKITGARATYSKPNGGTYTFSNPVIESRGFQKTYLLSVSYIPAEVVIRYLIEQGDKGLSAQVSSLIASGMLSTAVNKVCSVLGISGVAATVLAGAMQLNYYVINRANYHALKNAWDTYCASSTSGGLIATTKCTYNAGNGTSNVVTIFARWGSSTVNNTHYGMTGTWKDQVYYAGGEKITG